MSTAHPRKIFVGTASALLDWDDYEDVSSRKWVFHKGYAWFGPSHGMNLIGMHRWVMRPLGSLIVDHANGNKLDNRKRNLRVCTRSQNNINVGIRRDNSSGYKGVHYRADNKKWRANISVNKRLISIGSFKTAKEAAYAYDLAAKKHFGSFAWVNFPGDES